MRPGAPWICPTTGASRASPTRTIRAAAGGGFFPGGIGWYRKTFHAPADWKGKRVSVEFDGVYRDATVYLNGHKLGTHPYGYTAFTFDLTPGLNFSGANVLAVRVDNSAQPNSRWYSGSGIYRHVRIIVTDPTHMAHWGVFITTPEATSSSAKVSIRTRVANESSDARGSHPGDDAARQDGKHKIGSAQSKLSIAAERGRRSGAGDRRWRIPALWSPESPTLYHAVSTIRKDGKVIDQVTTPFGIRSLAWSAEKGLLLNGKADQAERWQRSSRQRTSRRRRI